MALEDLLETDHQARVVWDFCMGLDLEPLYESIRSREGGPGRAAIDPRLCVALWLYATLGGRRLGPRPGLALRATTTPSAGSAAASRSTTTPSPTSASTTSSSSTGC